jgi:hypothetical protein
MSEINHYSFSTRIGNAMNEIVKIISKSCNALNCSKLKTGYLATAEREMMLERLYDKNFAEFQNRYPTSTKACESQVIESSQDTRIKAIHTVSMFESLSQVKPMALVARTRHREKWEKVKSAISALKQQLEAVRFEPVEVAKLTQGSETLIRQMSYDTHSFLAQAEEELMLKKLIESTTSMAYSVKADNKSLIASMGPVFIRANADAGLMILDTTSFSGISCHAQMQKIEKDLKQRGLVLRRMGEHSMRLRKGGVRLNDPFPACPTDEHNHFLKGKVMTALPEEKSCAVSKPQNLLTHQYLQQMDSSRIKEKIA